MSTHEPSLLGELKTEVGKLISDLREMALLRWQLARSELESDARALKRLVLAWLTAALLILSALPLFAVCLADLLEGLFGVARWGWLLIIAMSMLTGSAAASYLAWLRFRKRATLMEQSLAELREDLVWLQEWLN
jgi:hypothetical protein